MHDPGWFIWSQTETHKRQRKLKRREFLNSTHAAFTKSGGGSIQLLFASVSSDNQLRLQQFSNLSRTLWSSSWIYKHPVPTGICWKERKEKEEETKRSKRDFRKRKNTQESKRTWYRLWDEEVNQVLRHNTVVAVALCRNRKHIASSAKSRAGVTTAKPNFCSQTCIDPR